MVVVGATAGGGTYAIAGAGRGRRPDDLDRAKLPSLAGGDRIAQARHEHIDSQLGDDRAIHLGELHFQQHFLGPDRTEGQHIDYVLGISLGDHSGALGNILGGNVAGKHDGGARRRDVDLFVREDPPFFFGGGGDVHIHAQVEAARTLQFVPDQQRHFARGPAMHQDLCRSHDNGIGDRVVGDRDSLAAAPWC